MQIPGQTQLSATRACRPSSFLHPHVALTCRVRDLPPEHIKQSPSGDWFVRGEVQRGVLPEILEELLSARKRYDEPSVFATGVSRLSGTIQFPCPGAQGHASWKMLLLLGMQTRTRKRPSRGSGTAASCTLALVLLIFCVGVKTSVVGMCVVTGPRRT